MIGATRLRSAPYCPREVNVTMPLHRIGHQFADDQIVVRRDCRHLGLFFPRVDRTGHLPQRQDRGLGRAIQASFQINGTGASHHVADAIGKNRMGQHGRGAGAVAHSIASALRCLPQHPGAEILLRVLQIEFLGDRHAVVADDRRSPALLDQHRLGFRSKRDAYRVAEHGRASQDLLAGRGTKR
jgi:hypothetical protein